MGAGSFHIYVMKNENFDINEVFDRVNRMFKNPEKTTAETISRLTGKIHLPGLVFKLIPQEENWFEIYPHPANPIIEHGKDKKTIVSIYIPGLFIGLGDEYLQKIITEIKEENNIIYLKLEENE